MEEFTLKVGSMFLSEAFQFIIAEKCNIQIIFVNVTTIFTYAIAQILSSSCNDAATLDSKLRNSLLHEVHLAY